MYSEVNCDLIIPTSFVLAYYFNILKKLQRMCGFPIVFKDNAGHFPFQFFSISRWVYVSLKGPYDLKPGELIISLKYHFHL